jgi:endoglucanase
MQLWSKVLLVSVALAVACIPKKTATPAGEAQEPLPAEAQEPPPADLPPAPPTNGANPFQGAKLFVDPNSQAAFQSRQAKGEAAKLVKLIADQPQADWLGEWTPLVGQEASKRIKAAEAAGALRVMVAYNVPNRDCGNYSKGGVKGSAAYKKWIHQLAAGIGEGRAVIILEPDALGLLKDCLTPADQQERLDMIRWAVRRLRQNPGTAVYIDAGNANWLPVPEIAQRLTGAGVEEAHGFSLNVSNFVATDKTVAYGKEVVAALGMKVGFVVDTSRNGQGEAPEKAWCNPPGRGLGQAPTTNTGDPLVHAFLWIKRPGESDGTCNGGPGAGQWFMDYALELARNARL